MAVPGTLSETLDNLYATTWQHMRTTVRDQIFDSTPLWFWLRDKGKLKTLQGGRFIMEPLQYAKNDSATWLGKGGTVSLNDFEFLTNAKYDWRYLVGNLVRFGIDDQQNRGKQQIIHLLNSKLDNLKNALVDTLETRLFGAEGATTLSIDGLQLQVPDDPTVAGSALGGIDPSTETWWRSKTKDMTGLSFASNGISEMRTMQHNVGNNLGSDQPDIWVTGQTPFEYYEDTVLDFYRTSNTKLAEAGFANQVFKGIPMVWSPACANTRAYLLNTNYLTFYYDPMLFFEMTEWKAIPDQVNDRAAQVILACALVMSRRRCHGVLHSIDTP